MKFEDLSPEDQALVNTDFGAMDKVAAEEIKFASELYAQGQEMACNTALQIEKIAEEAAEGKDEEEEEDEEEKKAASDYGNIIAEGFIDKLASLGQEYHGDPTHYFLPFVEEKIAEAGAKAALKKFFDTVGSKAKGVGSKAKAVGTAAKDKTVAGAKAVRDYHVGMAENLGAAGRGYSKATGAHGGKRDVALGAKGRLVEGLKGVGKASPYLAAAGGAGYMATRKKKDEQ